MKAFKIMRKEKYGSQRGKWFFNAEGMIVSDAYFYV